MKSGVLHQTEKKLNTHLSLSKPNTCSSQVPKLEEELHGNFKRWWNSGNKWVGTRTHLGCKYGHLGHHDHFLLPDPPDSPLLPPPAAAKAALQHLSQLLQSPSDRGCEEECKDRLHSAAGSMPTHPIVPMPPSHPILPAIPTTHKLPSSSSSSAAAAAVQTLDSKTNLNPNNQNSPEDMDLKLLKSSPNPPAPKPPLLT